MIHTDGFHVVGDTLLELHSFARRTGLTYYHEFSKGGPHYDIMNSISLERVLKAPGIRLTDDIEVLLISQKAMK